MPDSSNFKDKRGEPVSAYRQDLLQAHPGNSIDAVLTGKVEHGVVSLPARNFRAGNLELVEDVDPGDPICGHAHVLIVGPKSHTLRVELAESSHWEREPPA
jgi:hypothetical protein